MPNCEGLLYAGEATKKASMPSRSHVRIRSHNSEVLFPDTPTTRGIRLAFTSTTKSTTLRCSSGLSVGVSAVVPSTTKKSQPPVAKCSTMRCTAGKSTFPSA